MPSNEPRITHQRGFTYVGILLGVAMIGLGLSVAATVWSKEAERQRKAEADWALAQYEKALMSYYNAAPGSVKTLPNSLAELLLDARHLGVVRHLRKEYTVNCNHQFTANITYQPKSTAATLLFFCPSDDGPLARREIVLETDFKFPPRP